MTKNVSEVDAVQFIMDNVFDWEGQQKHAGLRLTYEDSKKLARSLERNLVATCPDVKDAQVFELFGELVHNNWLGEFDDIKAMTKRVVIAFLDSEMGSPDGLADLKREMKGKIKFMETHFSDVSHRAGLPLHVAAEVMEKNDRAETRQGAQGLSDNLNQIRTIVESGGQGRANFARRKFPGLFRLIGR